MSPGEETRALLSDPLATAWLSPMAGRERDPDQRLLNRKAWVFWAFGG